MRQLANYLRILTELRSGAAPLPPPFPNKLNFPPEACDALAKHILIPLLHGETALSDDEQRHLLFKLADWCRKKGAINRKAIIFECHEIWVPVSHALRAHPTWVTSRAGVGWACRMHQQWRSVLTKKARQAYVEPPRVADIAWLPGFYLVELTNGAHVHAEGEALGHCMAQKLSLDALKKRGFPPPDSSEARDCLTYAVKIRSGEMRIFSLRDPDGRAAATIAYGVKHKVVQRLEIRDDLRPETLDYVWSLIACASIKTLSDIVPIDGAELLHKTGCLRDCPGKGWCEKNLRLAKTIGIDGFADWRGRIIVPPQPEPDEQPARGDRT